MRTINIVFKSLYACAHQCGFCHVQYVPRNTSYMTTEEVKHTFDAIERQFSGERVELEMSGGEFTMRKDAVELIRYLRTKDIWWSSLVLDTMGVFLANEPLARDLGALFDKANVSVHACDEALHQATAASRTRFQDLEAGLRNVFRCFPAVFTNTALTRVNYTRVADIARFILRAREASPSTPLYCLFYMPVYREYGVANRENRFRLQGEDNGAFAPPAEALGRLREEFAEARRLLADQGVPAILRDFNVPACLYDSITGSFPDSAYGIPNFTAGSYFIDYEHPVAEAHTLDQVYSTTQGRAKPDACRRCIVDEICAGFPTAWSQAGYPVVPVDEARYAADFPMRLLNQTLFLAFHDAVKARQALSSVSIDWTRVAVSFAEWVGGSEIRLARARISQLSASERCRLLIQFLQNADLTGANGLASLLMDAARPVAHARS
jgi:MoaA/NifB/PqqE/SkfB family radical SAM enzyme